MCLLSTPAAVPASFEAPARWPASWPAPRRPHEKRLPQVLDLILPTFSPAARRRLGRAARDGRLIRSAYVDANGGACILHVLDPAIRARADRIRHFAADAVLLEASEDLVIGWDSGQITDEMLRTSLRRAEATDRECVPA